MEGLGELRFKESDRLTTMEKNLTACGISASVTEDVLTVRGKGAKRKGAVTIPVKFDQRIAMSFLVLGMVGGQSIAIDDSSIIRTSVPGFIPLMNALGASIKTDDGYVMS